MFTKEFYSRRNTISLDVKFYSSFRVLVKVSGTSEWLETDQEGLENIYEKFRKACEGYHPLKEGEDLQYELKAFIEEGKTDIYYKYSASTLYLNPDMSIYTPPQHEGWCSFKDLLGRRVEQCRNFFFKLSHDQRREGVE